MASLKQGATIRMPVTGELIRMMNYVDDIAATLRRIQAGVPGMTEDERTHDGLWVKAVGGLPNT